MSQSHKKVERLLAEVVTVKTKGAATAARPGQLQLACDIMDRLDAARNGGTTAETQLAGEAPTGVGKSFALLAAAFIDADDHGRRTVISTQQKVLQNQIVTIDAPDMRQAAANLGMKDIGVEILKGWQSYACLQRARETADELAGEAGWGEYLKQSAELGEPGDVVIDGVTYDRRSAEHAVAWAYALDPEDDSRDYGDMAAFRPLAAERKRGAWPPGDPAQLITITREDCLKADCPFWDNGCAPQKSRLRAKDADIVVTNHALLGIQAALGAKTVFGNKLLGDFDNLMVDEAHDLSDEVRNRGTQTFTADTLNKTAKRILAFTREAAHINARHAADDLSGQQAAADTIHDLETVATCLNDCAPELEEALTAFLTVGAEGTERTLLTTRSYDRSEALERLAACLREALELAGTALRRSQEGGGDAVVQRSPDSESPRWAAINACSSLDGILERFTAKGPKVDATWIKARALASGERGEGHVAPLDVATRIRRRLWKSGAEPRASIAVSATMPENFVRACGMDPEVECVGYESPYAAAYGDTALYIPRLSPSEIEQLTLAPAVENGKPSFNHAEHPHWASAYIGGLVRANRGAALVLSATKGAGEHYAGYLRRLFPGAQILDQWSTEKEEAIQRWKDDESSVLVGTKSLMTGVDAYGPTNSLVIVDKITRSPEDPLLKDLVSYLALSMEWEAAIREVYVVPGANLLKQSGGRLIRRESDSGMFAVLEPRFHKDNVGIPGHFGDDTKKVHKSAVKAFRRKVYELDKALDFLEHQSAHRPRLDSFRPGRAA